MFVSECLSKTAKSVVIGGTCLRWEGDSADSIEDIAGRCSELSVAGQQGRLITSSRPSIQEVMIEQLVSNRFCFPFLYSC